MRIELSTFLGDFADALKAVDSSGLSHKHFQPGIGPYGESDAVRAALHWLKEKLPIGIHSRLPSDFPIC